jgi:prophage regulatory protein
MPILRLKDVMKLTGHKSGATIYRQIRDGLFTKPVRIGTRSVGWPDFEVVAIVKARVAGATLDAICQLVDRLHSNRTGLLLDLSTLADAADQKVAL